MIETLDDFKKEFVKIKEMGFVESHRTGPTAIGKTLEDLLGITENNFDSPDFGKYELKAKREEDGSMLTLFTKKPLPDSSMSTIIENYGYYTKRSSSHKSIHSTLSTNHFSPISDTGKKLKVDVSDNKVKIIDDSGNVPAYYTFDLINECLNKKYPESLVHAFAKSKKENSKEYFAFTRAFCYGKYSFQDFIQLIKDGKIKIDLRVGSNSDGSIHDHGTGFRIEERHLNQLFKEIKVL